MPVHDFKCRKCGTIAELYFRLNKVPREKKCTECGMNRAMIQTFERGSGLASRSAVNRGNSELGYGKLHPQNGYKESYDTYSEKRAAMKQFGWEEASDSDIKDMIDRDNNQNTVETVEANWGDEEDVKAIMEGRTVTKVEDLR